MKEHIQKPTNLPELIPSVKLSRSRRSDIEFDGYESATYENKRREIITRDNEQCQFCFFRVSPDRGKAQNTYLASGFLEVHHLDDDHKNNSADNLITICPFCHQVFHVGYAGHVGRFKIISLPWLTQAELNLLINCIFVVFKRKKTCPSETFAEADSIYSYLKTSLHYRAIEEMGDAIRDPKSLGTALYSLHKKNSQIYKNRNKALKNIRILPLYEKFEKAIEFWEKNSWNPGYKWHTAFEEIFNKWKTSVKK